MREWKIHKVKGINVSYLPHLDGGGSTFGRQFVPLLQYLTKPVSVAFEWCCGPAFIGFSLLGNGLCRQLFLSDANPEVESAVRRTVRENALGRVVRFYVSDTIRALPKSGLWDLVVANPPHFNQRKGNLRADDPNWQTHREFFDSIHSRLQPNADIFLQENFMGASPDAIVRLADLSKLYLLNVFTTKAPGTHDANVYYFLHFKPKSEQVSIVKKIPKPLSVTINLGGSPSVLTVPANQLIRLRLKNRAKRRIVVNLFSSEWMRLMNTYTIPKQSEALTHAFSLGEGESFLADCESKEKICLINVC
jgi:hypothetical protein